MKSCRSCPNTEDKVLFVTGRNQCKECYNTWFREYYKKNTDKREDNRELVRENRPNRRKKKKEFVTNLKRGQPCTDCGKVYHPYVMDYDHLDPKLKLTHVSDMMLNCYSEQNILDEIAKCELVCSNCHRIRTVIRKIGKEEYEKFIAEE